MGPRAVSPGERRLLLEEISCLGHHSLLPPCSPHGQTLEAQLFFSLSFSAVRKPVPVSSSTVLLWGNGGARLWWSYRLDPLNHLSPPARSRSLHQMPKFPSPLPCRAEYYRILPPEVPKRLERRDRRSATANPPLPPPLPPSPASTVAANASRQPARGAPRERGLVWSVVCSG